MKRILILGLGVFLLGAVTAQAQTPFQFDCQFAGGAGKKGSDRCRAYADLCEDIANGQIRQCQDMLAVSCNDVPVFFGNATHVAFGDFQLVSGVPSAGYPTPPTLRYATADVQPTNPDYYLSAWLTVDGFFLNGFCRVTHLLEQ